MRTFKEKKDKAKELILYIADRSSDDPNFGSVKLNKILFLCDFWAYGNLGEPITGMEYQKLQQGPAPRRLLPIRGELERAGDLVVQQSTLDDPQMMWKRPISLRAADLSKFTAKEIALVDEVLQFCRSAAGAGLSRYTHNWHGWIAAEEGETIPYEKVFISDDPITPFEIARGKKLAAKYGWRV